MSLKCIGHNLEIRDLETQVMAWGWLINGYLMFTFEHQLSVRQNHSVESRRMDLFERFGQQKLCPHQSGTDCSQRVQLVHRMVSTYEAREDTNEDEQSQWEVVVLEVVRIQCAREEREVVSGELDSFA